MQKLVTQVPDATGHFGPYGGMFVPETLMAPLHRLTQEYEKAKGDKAFRNEFEIFARGIRGPAHATLPGGADDRAARRRENLSQT